MTPFISRCPGADGGRMLKLRVQDNGLPLPPGEYAFLEWFCDDPKCDCRRALLRVMSPQHPGRVLATLNYGWENAAFYTEWMRGDPQAGEEITNASLDPLNPQSELAEALLDGFRDYVRLDPFYPQQLQQHYDLFKSTFTPQPTPLPPPFEPGLTPAAILRQLEHLPKRADYDPYETALIAAAEHREALVPELIAALDRVSAQPRHYQKNPEACLHLFAIYLLAQFRERRALPAIRRFFSLPGSQSLDLSGDLVFEQGAAVLASVCGGDPAPLLQLAQDETVNEFVRGAAMAGLLVQTGWGERPRAAVIEDLRRLFQTLPKPGHATVWAELIRAVCNLEATELLPEARRAFAEELVDGEFIGPEELDELEAAEPTLVPPASGAKGRSARRGGAFREFCERNSPIYAAVECSLWSCFSDESAAGDFGDDDGNEDDLDEADEAWPRPAPGGPPPASPYEPPPAPIPYVAPPKVGRNEPCPCGSGKKYKKCCGKN